MSEASDVLYLTWNAKERHERSYLLLCVSALSRVVFWMSPVLPLWCLTTSRKSPTKLVNPIFLFQYEMNASLLLALLKVGIESLCLGAVMAKLTGGGSSWPLLRWLMLGRRSSGVLEQLEGMHVLTSASV